MPIVVSNQESSKFEKITIPARVYKACLDGLRLVEMDDYNNPGQKVTKISWSFAILGGKTRPVIEMLTNAKASLGNEKSGNRKFYVALTGQAPPTTGETDLEDLIGLECNVRVGDHTNTKGATYSIIVDCWALDQAENTEAPF